jgi:hypothetical protein
VIQEKEVEKIAAASPATPASELTLDLNDGDLLLAQSWI